MKAVSAHAAVLGERSNRITNPLRIACVVLPAALFLGLAWVDYRDELARTRNDVATATNALAEHARTVVESVDLVIARVMEHIAHGTGQPSQAHPRRMISWTGCGASCLRSRRYSWWTRLA